LIYLFVLDRNVNFFYLQSSEQEVCLWVSLHWRRTRNCCHSWEVLKMLLPWPLVYVLTPIGTCLWIKKNCDCNFIILLIKLICINCFTSTLVLAFLVFIQALRCYWCTVKSLIFVGHLILCISWVGQSKNLRSQQFF